MIGVVLITNPSCGNCRKLEELWEKLSYEYDDVKFITIDAAVRPEALHTYNVEHIPSVVFVDTSGNGLDAIDGADWVTRGTIVDKLAERGYQPDIGAFLVSVNKVRETWYWWVIGALVVIMAFLVLKKKK